MTRQNFAATAIYFAQRAKKASSVRRKQQLEAAAAHYWSMAEAYGHHSTPEGRPMPQVSTLPPRRQRLIELFHSSTETALRPGAHPIVHTTARQLQNAAIECDATPSE